MYSDEIYNTLFAARYTFLSVAPPCCALPLRRVMLMFSTGIPGFYRDIFWNNKWIHEHPLKKTSPFVLFLPSISRLSLSLSFSLCLRACMESCFSLHWRMISRNYDPTKISPRYPVSLTTSAFRTVSHAVKMCDPTNRPELVSRQQRAICESSPRVNRTSVEVPLCPIYI